MPRAGNGRFDDRLKPLAFPAFGPAAPAEETPREPKGGLPSALGCFQMTLVPNRIRVATLQYFIRPIGAFSDFAEQVRSLVETASNYRCQLVVFPEYFTTQLLTLGDTQRPVREQIIDLARQEARVSALLDQLARRYHIIIVGGSIPARASDGTLRNRCYIYGVDGRHARQDKIHMTRFEDESWGMTNGEKLMVIEASFGKFAVAICYDVEFPEIAHVAALQGAQFLITPSCTDDRQGFLRVRYCAQARAIENQMYVVHAGTVGSLPMVPAVSLNYGQASILTPSDFSFARDGILAEGVANQESMVIGDLDLDLIDESRTRGTVLPLRDSQRRGVVLEMTEAVSV